MWPVWLDNLKAAVSRLITNTSTAGNPQAVNPSTTDRAAGKVRDMGIVVKSAKPLVKAMVRKAAEVSSKGLQTAGNATKLADMVQPLSQKAPL